MHTNTTICPGCEAKLVGIDPRLISFAAAFRASNPDGHISCGYRNQAEQESDFTRGVSRAHWLQSPHNFAAALDWFRLTQAAGASFDAPWYQNVLAPAVAATDLVWGGSFTTITDMPHVETPDWRTLKGP